MIRNFAEREQQLVNKLRQSQDQAIKAKQMLEKATI
jgi:hypothetical protein